MTAERDAYVRSRPDYVKCSMLTEPHPDLPAEYKKTYCGRSIQPTEFMFTSASHAIMNGRNQGRLLLCKFCSAEMERCLKEGSDG